MIAYLLMVALKVDDKNWYTDISNVTANGSTIGGAANELLWWLQDAVNAAKSSTSDASSVVAVNNLVKIFLTGGFILTAATYVLSQ